MESRRTFLKRSTLTIAATTIPGVSSCIGIQTIRAKVPLRSNEIRYAAVLWYSQTGNTQKCGEVLAKTFDVKGITVTFGDLRYFDQAKIK